MAIAHLPWLPKKRLARETLSLSPVSYTHLVMAAREVMILCNGHNKARALQAAIEGPVTQAWTISALQTHPCGIIVCDDAATDELKVSTYRYFKDIEKNNL